MILSVTTLFDRRLTRISIYSAITVLWLAAVCYRCFPDPQGTDFYPLWIGAQELLHGGDPYGKETAELLRNTWLVKLKGVQVADVIGYPLPVLLLITPLTIFPLEIAVYVWFALLLASVAIFALEVGGETSGNPRHTDVELSAGARIDDQNHRRPLVGLGRPIGRGDQEKLCHSRRALHCLITG